MVLCLGLYWMILPVLLLLSWEGGVTIPGSTAAHGVKRLGPTEEIPVSIASVTCPVCSFVVLSCYALRQGLST